MATETIDVYKKKRGVLRTSVTKTIKKLETELGKTEVDENGIEENLEQLNDSFESLKSIDIELEKRFKLEDLEKEITSAEEYREKVVSCRFKAGKCLRILKQRETEINHSPPSLTINEDFKSNSKHSEINVKLPKISIPKFKGDVSQWLTFFNSFETAIHKNESLSKVSKFNYLKAHLEGTALETVEGFSLSAENYDEAIKLLEERFGRKEVLINTHLNNLLQIPPLKRSSDVKCFRKLFDKCQTQIRSLDSLGVSVDTFGILLCPIILKLLPHDLVFDFNKECDNANYTINHLMEFLSRQVSAREKADSCFLSVNQKENFSFFPTKRNESQPPTPRLFGAERDKHLKQERNKFVTASDLLTSEVNERKNLCVFCDRFHKSNTCEFARNLSIGERKSILMKKGACFRCLKMNHLSRDCRVKLSCIICGKRHYDLMCFTIIDGNLTKQNMPKEINVGNESAVLSNNSHSTDVYLETLIVYIKENDVKHLVRILIDTGSQRSYISKFVARKMGLKCLGEETVIHGLFGGIENTEKHKRYQISLSSIDNNFNCNLEVMDKNKICASIPKLKDENCIRELKELGIFVSDIEISGKSCLHEYNSNEIHLLIGADVAGKLLSGSIKHLSSGLVAVHTHLGWSLMGKANGENKVNSSLLVLSLHVNNAKISDLWDLDTLGIKDISEQRTKLETQELAVKHFEETVTEDHSGRFKVCLPWLEGHPPLSDHEDLAYKRLKTTVKSLKSMNKLEAYQEVFDEWEKEGIIERIISKDENKFENKGVHYLPHRAVFKENTTTKIRPVFDGSAKTCHSPSINECIEKGPNLIELIPSVLNRFRWGKIGVIADIRKAFLQISLNESDRNFLRFLWWQDGDPNQLVTYRHCRVVFGISCSPFLLASVLNLVLDQVEEPLRNLAKKLKDSMYVDNCVASVDSVEELEYFRTESQKLFSSARFDLRGWKSNQSSPKERQDDLDSENSNLPVLGLSWNISTDYLSCELNDIEQEHETVTKRRILSVAHRIFDPIGFTCPVTLIPKLILQECWKLEATWDSKLPEDIVRKFDNWKKQLIDLKNIKIPRRLSKLDLNEANLSLHVFCDASKSCYATCIFLRAEKGGEVTCQLVQARSRVAPLKCISIPRLELLSCLIGARLADSVKKDLNLGKIETTYWSDSMDVLYWIKREGPWAIFVSNRVREIRNLSSISGWKYVPGVLNPADLPSRGCSVKALIKGNWWEGPLWLRSSRDEWPKFKLTPNEEIINAEKKKIIVSSVNHERNEYYHRISSYKKILRVTGWIYRFFENTRATDKKYGELSAEELKKAEHTIMKVVQKESFSDERKAILKTLPIKIDTDGLIRVISKIYLRKDEENFRFPIVLPSDHNVVKSLIIWKHKELGHSGVQFLMVALRENYWILKSRRTIKRIIKTCVICQRFSARPPDILEGPLPEDRVKNASIFEVIGIDVAGPLFLKNGQKTWILILTCAVYRAVHLELLTSLSTDNLLLALRRFIARRGRPSVIYSDNGTNFVGAENLLKNIDLEKLKPTIAPITWKFIPPAAPWWGGFWERLVGLMKQILRKVLGKSSLSYDEMVTVLCDCEGILNCRPLTHVSDDANDLDPITPAMFLHENRNSDVTDLDHIDQIDRKELNKRLVYRRRVLENLRSRFRIEYLGQLRQNNLKSNKANTMNVGDIVLVWTENSKRITWPLGRVLTLYPSKDGLIRMAQIKIKSGVLIRPIRKLCPLELDQDKVLNTVDPAPNPDALVSTPSPVDSSSTTDPVGTDYSNPDAVGPVPSPDSSVSDSAPVSPVITTRAGRIIRVPEHYRH